MDLDEKISRSIDRKVNDLAQLFNDADDAGEQLGLLKQLLAVRPLLQDIKTEVKSLESYVKTLPQKPEEEEDDDEQDDETQPVDDPHLDELLPEVKDLLAEGSRLRDKLKKDLKDALPDPSGNTLPDLPDWVKLIPGVEVAGLIAKVISLARDIKKTRDDDKAHTQRLLEALTEKDIKEITRTLIENAEQFLQDLTEDTVQSLNDELERLIDEVINQLNQSIFQVGTQMGVCCSNLGEEMTDVGRTVRDIDDKIDDLEPARQAGNDLAVMQKENAILAEVSAIRGLL